MLSSKVRKITNLVYKATSLSARTLGTQNVDVQRSYSAAVKSV